MANRLNPAEQTAAESDYEKKFNHDSSTSDNQDIKKQESEGDASWKTTTSAKIKTKHSTAPKKRGLFRFIGRRAGTANHGSAFAFVIVVLGLGVWYTSVLAPNILLVNIKEMYTNDLADSTIALNTYYWKMMNYKIGRPNCGEKESIKCKLSTMSRAQKKAFEKHGFTVIGTKVNEDGRDTGQSASSKQPESRYQVVAILPPKYKETIDTIKSTGLSWLTSGFRGGLSGMTGQLKSIGETELKKYTSDFLTNMPIATGDMLWLYAQLSSGTKAQVYSVFNPKSSFYMDTRFKQRIKSKYGLTKSITTSGNTEQAVNKSFDWSVRNSGGGIDTFGRPDPQNGISLGALSNPVTAAQLEFAMLPLAAQATSYAGLQCAWYAFGKAVTNDAKSAKAATVARFAMQYLKAADQIKAGTSQDITINTLSSKLASNMVGGYGGQGATESTMYKSIVYGAPPIPSVFGLLYYLDTFDLIGALVPSWSQIMASAAAQGAASSLPGQLLMPPGNLTGTDRDYCLEGEKQTNHSTIKNDMTGQCIPQVQASAPPGWQGALGPAEIAARETCNPPHDHYIHSGEAEHDSHGVFQMQPSVKSATGILSPYVAGLFSVNVIAWANVVSLLFTSQTKGVAASDAIFAGTGEVLGDMAQSRGMMPANIASMAEYLAYKPAVDKEFNDIARYNGRKNPFDPYNKFSFVGSIFHSLSPSYDSRAPLLATIMNSFSLLKSGVKKLNHTANAFYYLQPQIPDIDPLNPLTTGALHATGLAKYLLRLNCPDPEYLAILINADTGCNVRYSISRLELAAQIDSVLDYMTKPHTDAYQEKIDELLDRAALADVEDGDKANTSRMLAVYYSVLNQPFIDKKTGRAIPNSEYDKFLQYCVNRQDPWGRSGIHVYSTDLPDSIKRKRLTDKDTNLQGMSPYDSGDPYQKISFAAFPAVTEGAKAEQDWYTGKKCLEQSEMLTNFRAYTLACSVDGSLSGGVDCSDNDNSAIASGTANDFFTSNDILYTSG